MFRTRTLCIFKYYTSLQSLVDLREESATRGMKTTLPSPAAVGNSGQCAQA